MPPAERTAVPSTIRLVRLLLDETVKTDADLEGFCLDFFPQVQRQFSSGMPRQQKENLLFQMVDPRAILTAVTASQPAAKQRYHELLTQGDLVATESQAGPRWMPRWLLLTILGGLLLSAGGYKLAAWRKAQALHAQHLRLDGLLQREGDPPPPSACRVNDLALAIDLVQAAELLAGASVGRARPQDRAALARLRQLSLDTPHSAELLVLLSRAHLAVDADGASAAKAAAAAVASCPGFALAHKLRGNAEQRNQKPAMALPAYEQALRFAPNYVAPRWNLGLLHLGMGRHREALSAFDEVLRSPQPPTDIHLVRGQTLLLLGQPQLAALDLETAASHTPDRGEVFMLLGQARQALGQTAIAGQAFCRARQLGIAAAQDHCADKKPSSLP